jgi:hypothetical protein
MAVATVTVGWQDKEWVGDIALTAMILSTTTKMMRTATKKEGGWDHPPP